LFLKIDISKEQSVFGLKSKNSPFGSIDFPAGAALQAICGDLLQQLGLCLDLRKTLLMRNSARFSHELFDYKLNTVCLAPHTLNLLIAGFAATVDQVVLPDTEAVTGDQLCVTTGTVAVFPAFAWNIAFVNIV